MLTKEEIDFFVGGYTRDEIPDYQAAALLMAVLLRGMSDGEVAYLTAAMAGSGQILSLRSVAPLVADKHSTGGVGDKTTLVVAPLVAAAGLPVAKMSGRGLGFTGGTLDKLEAIPGFRTNLSVADFVAQVGRCGIAIAGQSRELAPADGKLYALRDATATVPSIPLIASSIMSKKIAAGADVIVLDVKVGLGAFMKTVESARELSQLMVRLGTSAGRRVSAILAGMDQPLGNAVGNGLEVREAIATLRGCGPVDLVEHCLLLAAHMLLLGGAAVSVQEARGLADKALASGHGLAKFAELVREQGGNARVVDDPEGVLLPAPIVTPVRAERSGYVKQVDAERVGSAAVMLGAGRERKDDGIDHRVGIVLHKKAGDAVAIGESLFTVHSADQRAYAAAVREVLAAYTWSTEPVPAPQLVYEVIQ